MTKPIDRNISTLTAPIGRVFGAEDIPPQLPPLPRDSTWTWRLGRDSVSIGTLLHEAGWQCCVHGTKRTFNFSMFPSLVAHLRARKDIYTRHPQDMPQESK